MPEEMPVIQISDPQAMLGLPERSTQLGKVGRAATKRQKELLDLIRRMQTETMKGPDGRITGPLRPCTVVNYNPVDLVIEGQLNLRVQKAGASEHHHLDIPFMGRWIEGHYQYIASPMVGEGKPDKEPTFYSTVTGHETDSILPIDMPVCQARMFSPHSIACELWNQYNSPDNKLMGGILMFDQNPHTLSAANLAKTGGRIWVPERVLLSDSTVYSYRLRETLLVDELGRIFETQRNYCDVIIQQADALWNEQDIVSRKMVTNTHRDWDRFAVKMGWKEKLQEWTTAKLAVTGEMKTLLPCPQCGTQQPSPDAYFCRNCNAPYDAFDAFMAGKVVPMAFLEVLPEEKLEEVLAVMEERRARREKLEGRGTKTKKEKPAAQPAGA
jgi:hypothetical protein